MKKQFKPNKTRDRIVIVILAILFLLACFTSPGCSAAPKMRKDCRGVWHEKQKGGFYL